MTQTIANDVVLDCRFANALFADARLSSNVGNVFRRIGARSEFFVIRPILNAFSAAQGGLWVGGRAELTERALRFRPNSLNKFFHDNGEELIMDLPLADITSVRSRFGLISQIIEIETSDDKFSLRCSSAKKFAASINLARHDIH